MNPKAPPPGEAERIGHAVDQLTLDAWRLEPGVGRPAAPASPRFHRILVATDGSPGSRLAVAWAGQMAHVHGAKVWALAVAVPPDVVDHYLEAIGSLGGRGPSSLYEEEKARATQHAEEAAAELRKSGLEAEPRVAHGPAVRTIVEHAAHLEADLVVLGSHRRNLLGRTLLGSVADGVKNTVPASVLIAKTPPPAARVLVATDGSQASKRAAGLGLELGRAWDVPATVLYVFSPLHAGTDEEMGRMQDAALGGVDLSWARAKTSVELEFGDPAERIVHSAERWGAGLVVMGSRGLSGLESLVAGGVSNRVSHEVAASVLLVKQPTEAPG